MLEKEICLLFFSGDEMYLISLMLAVNPLTPRSD